MSDGSDMGITAGRALNTILGGDEQPTEDEQASKEEAYARIMSRPNPLEGGNIWETFGPGMDAYSVATDCITKAFLLEEAAQPGILEKKIFYSPENTDIEDLWGKELSPDWAVWKAVSNRYPGFDDWIGGASGFMVGFAYNCARWLRDMETVQNPAIMTVRSPE